MLKYGKTSQNAIMAMSCLAEAYDGGKTRLTSSDIARARKLPQPIVAKLLVSLSQSGLIDGAPGPHGGYWLAREPELISLLDIVSLFEKIGERISCPFGAEHCQSDAPCPLHRKLAELDQQLIEFLQRNTMETFLDFARNRPGPSCKETQLVTEDS